MVYIYHHINKQTGEVFYVGQGIKGRAYSIKSRSEFWHNIVNKYGYLIEIVETDLSKDVANEREIYWVAKFGRRDLGKGPLVNHTDGGGGILGYKHTIETKEIISNTHKGRKLTDNHKINVSNGVKKLWTSESYRQTQHEAYLNSNYVAKKQTEEVKIKRGIYRKGKDHPSYGKEVSDETRKKISEGHIGKTFSDETKLKMSESHKGKSKEIVTCPYCDKSGGIGAMMRWHFNNCKKTKI